MDKNVVDHLKSEGFIVIKHKQLKDKTVFIAEKEGIYYIGTLTSNRVSVSSFELSLKQAEQAFVELT
ncbi:hypothetical protein N0B30_22495 (plasmid) [Bacillus subtilis]|uniref:hypothetical protein n=1 Tax=Bacillus subtilis group TaxID=653685 RepID=UPI000CE00DF8|nr:MULTISPECIES: hypothetical protein [Bacillus subtilis group]AVB12178.1 hypothetical protein C3438_22240 [Bacillus velezensis]MCT6515401.1 hypothetical protein [Bacillus subtilis]MEC0407614.1 hypothetical protein [Bacillus subtilis]MEC0419507.1 hypothetical protein [Bacillus subtilis]MEC0449072.1 hypothetical protein [Bacillus subtilis]